MNKIIYIFLIIIILFLFKNLIIKKSKKENFQLINNNNQNISNKFIFENEHYRDMLLKDKLKQYNIIEVEDSIYNDKYNNSSNISHPNTNYAIENEILNLEIQKDYNNLVKKCNENNNASIILPYNKCKI